MGDMAEMYSWYDFEEDDREEEYASRGIWPAKNGEIPVSEMSDDHLFNALLYIRRKSPNSPLQFMLEDEIERRSKREVMKEMPSISAFAIRQKLTGAYLPARKNGRGYSYDEPTNEFPRLFESRASAARALSAWLQGQWKREYHTREVDGWPEDIEYLTTERVEGRNPSDMEIVEFVLLEVLK